MLFSLIPGYITHWIDLKSTVDNFRDNFKCLKCNAVFTQEEKLKTHIKYCSNTSNRILKCKFCGFTTFKRSELSTHFFKVHARKV